jgi:type II secretory ATPase GspE/PulE/Tfp pilus assembly ATPase PilB-like protein
LNLEQWLGEDNKLGQDIWHKKYQYENETFDEWLDRVSGGNEAIKRLIIDNASSEALKNEAVKQGMHTLHRSAAINVVKGVTTMSEMRKVSNET